MMLKEVKYCTGCQACSQICPKNCIQMGADEEGFLYPVIDKETCIQCGLCEKVCPVLCSAEEFLGEPKAYAAYIPNEQIRLASSSGGVFSLLAEYVLDQEGILYGAAMVGTGVKHIRVADRDGLESLRGSKYVQSDIGQTYIQARADLEADKTVLFTGTPCQIEGLKSFLRKEYRNLITMDIICHGVPSPAVWKKYIDLCEQKAGAPVTRVSFRDKRHGWKNFGILLEFSNGTAYTYCHDIDLFMQVFLRNLCLRPSCYQCSFKKVNRVSDITMADFWGIQTVCPEMDDDKGTSLVIVHSKKGTELFRHLSTEINCREVPFEAAIRGNSAMICSVEKPKHRDAFMKRIRTEPFERLAKTYTKEAVTAKRVLKKILKKAGLLQLAKELKKWLTP